MTASKSIRLKCIECSGDSPMEVTLCYITDCALWPRRMGTDAKAKKRFEKAKLAHKEAYKWSIDYADDPVKFAKGF